MSRYASIPARAITDARLAPIHLRVLLALGSFSAPLGDTPVWASVARIAEQARVDERHARRALKALEALGYIRREQRGHQTALTVIVWEDPIESAPEAATEVTPALVGADATGAAAAPRAEPARADVARADAAPTPGQMLPPNQQYYQPTDQPNHPAPSRATARRWAPGEAQRGRRDHGRTTPGATATRRLPPSSPSPGTGRRTRHCAARPARRSPSTSRSGSTPKAASAPAPGSCRGSAGTASARRSTR